MTLHETSPKTKIYFLEPDETERTVIRTESEDDLPNLEKNDCGKNLEIQLSPQLSRCRRYAVTYPWMIADSSKAGRYLRKPIKDSSNGGSYSRKPILKNSSNGDSYPRQPIEDSSNGGSYSRKPILKNSSNGAGNSKKTNEDTSNKENRPRKKVTFQDHSNGKSCHRKTTEFSDGQSYTENTILESTNNENCCNRTTIKGSSKCKQPLRDASNSGCDFYRNLDIINISNSSVPNSTSALAYNSDDTLARHSFSLFFNSSDQKDDSILLTSTPKGKRKSEGAKSILKDTTAKSYSFCKETLSKADLGLGSIKSCLKTSLNCKIVDSKHEVSSSKLFNRSSSCEETLSEADLRLESCLKTSLDSKIVDSKHEVLSSKLSCFGEETLSKANLRLESIKSCVRTSDQPISNISWCLNTGFYKRTCASTTPTPDRLQTNYYPSTKTYRDFLDFERKQLDAIKDMFSASIVTEIPNAKTKRSPFFLKDLKPIN